MPTGDTLDVKMRLQTFEYSQSWQYITMNLFLTSDFIFIFYTLNIFSLLNLYFFFACHSQLFLPYATA